MCALTETPITRTYIQGEGKRYTGKVEFSEEEVRGQGEQQK